MAEETIHRQIDRILSRDRLCKGYVTSGTVDALAALLRPVVVASGDHSHCTATRCAHGHINYCKKATIEKGSTNGN